MAEQTLDRGTDARDRGQSALLWVFVVALAVRTFASFRVSVIHNDGPTFLEIANQIAAGDWSAALTHPYHPFYPFLIALARNLTGDWESAAITCSVVGGAIAVLALYLFLRDAFDARVAWVAGLIFAVTPYAVRFSSDVESEGVYLAFFLLAVVSLYRSLTDKGRGYALAAGVLAGFAYLVRPEGMGVVIVGAGLAGAQVIRQRRSLRAWVGWMLASCGGFALVAGPYLVMIQSIGGPLRLSGKKSFLRLAGLTEREPMGFLDFASGLVAYLVEHRLAAALGVLALLGLTGLLMYWRRRPNQIAGLGRRFDRAHGRWIVASVVVALLAWGAGPVAGEDFARVVISSLRPEVAIILVIGLMVDRRRLADDRGIFIAALVGAYLLVLLGLVSNYGYLSRRHVVPITPLVLGYAALGLLALADRLPEVLARVTRGRLRLSKSAALAISVSLLVVIALPKTFDDHRRDDRAQRQAAEWLRENHGAAGRLAASKSRVAYYAEREWSPLYDGVRLRSLDALRKDEVRYIVVDDKILRSHDGIPDASGLSLREIHRVEESGRLAFVYALTEVRAGSASAGPAGRDVR